MRLSRFATYVLISFAIPTANLCLIHGKLITSSTTTNEHAQTLGLFAFLGLQHSGLEPSLGHFIYLLHFGTYLMKRLTLAYFYSFYGNT